MPIRTLIMGLYIERIMGLYIEQCAKSYKLIVSLDAGVRRRSRVACSAQIGKDHVINDDDLLFRVAACGHGLGGVDTLRIFL